MRNHTVWINLLCVLLFPCIAALAQDTGKKVPPAHAEPSPTILTGDMLDGIKYYIKIVPHDTALDEHMPTYTPDGFVPVDEPPVPIRKVKARYPAGAGERVYPSGTVWINCLIGKDGKVVRTKVLRADAKLLIDPAVAAVKQWLFSPAKLKGEPIPVWAAIPIRVGPGK